MAHPLSPRLLAVGFVLLVAAVVAIVAGWLASLSGAKPASVATQSAVAFGGTVLLGLTVAQYLTGD